MNESQLSENNAGFKDQLKWLWGIFILPKKTMAEIIGQTKKVWLLPLLIMSITAVLYANASVKVMTSGFQPNFGAPGAGMPMEEGAPIGMEVQEMEGMPSNDAVLDEYGEPLDAPGAEKFPGQPTSPNGLLSGVGKVIRVWGSWIVLAAVLYLALTLSGGRMGFNNVMNIVAWSGMPLALRDVVRMVYVNMKHLPINSPGLSGLVTGTPPDNTYYFMIALFTLVDVYLLWSIALLVIGGKEAGNLSLGKAIKAVVIPVVLLLVLYAVVSAGATVVIAQMKEGAAAAAGGGF